MTITTYQGGLRGTRARRARTTYDMPLTRRGIPIRIKNLERQLKGLRPHLECFRESFTHSTGTGVTRVGHDITAGFIASSQYTNSVLGDTYKNVYLRSTHIFPPEAQAIRVLVYRLMRPGASFAPSNTEEGFVTPPDPAFVKLITDKYITPPNGNTGTCFTLTHYLGNYETVINRSNSNVIEKGEFFMLIQTKGNGTATSTNYTQLYYRNS